MIQGIDRNRWHGRILASALTLAVAGCSTMPAFGPDAETINRSATDDAVDVPDVLPFDIVNVTATTLPSKTASAARFPAAFRNQRFRGADEVVAAGDHLEIRIWEVAEDGLFATAGRRETVLNVAVSNSGNITVPYAEKIAAQGLTTAQLRALLLNRYRGKAIEPEIAVAITETQSRSATILGDVAAPGRATIPSRGIRLLDLIAQAGGSPQLPWEVTVKIQRGSASARLPLSSIFDDTANNIVILPGDTVNVAHEPRRFAVYGGVNKPSNIEIPIQDAHLAYLLAEVGGLNDRIAQARSVFVFRPSKMGGASQTARAYRLDFSRPDALLLAGAFALKATDITYIASADAAEFQKFVSIILSPFLGTATTTSNLGN